jgi:hypothetical protein
MITNKLFSTVNKNKQALWLQNLSDENIKNVKG